MQIKVTRTQNYNAAKIVQKQDIQHAKHKYIKRDFVNGKWRYYYDYNNGDGWSDKVGVTVGKKKGTVTVEAFNTKNNRYWQKYEKTIKKKYGPVTVEKAEDGISYKLDIPVKKMSAVAKKHINAGKNKLRKLFGI